jgi:ADP-ribose pyrophosphatase
MAQHRLAYSCPWFDVFEEASDAGGKSVATYSIIVPTRPSVVAVVANGHEEILFVGVCRVTTGSQEWELPAGRMEAGESSIEAARREVLEEAGVVTVDVREIGSVFPMNGFSSAVVHVCQGVVERATGNLGAEFECRWMSRLEIMQIIARNEMRDGVSLAALALYWAGRSS